MRRTTNRNLCLTVKAEYWEYWGWGREEDCKGWEGLLIEKETILKMKVKLKILILILIVIIPLLFIYEPAFSIEIPKFPYDIENHVERKLAVFYSPDEINSLTTLNYLGYPDKKLFMLHRDHPQLKITMQTVPSYAGESGFERPLHMRDIIISGKQNFYQGICCANLWRMIMYNATFTSWMEIGNHGYTHSPPDQLDPAHEFDEKDTPLANDYDYGNERFKLARDAYKQIGLDNNKIIVMRFPGYDYTDAALRALLDNGFIGFFDRGPSNCTEKFILLSDEREILSIPSFYLDKVYNNKLNFTHLDYCVKQGNILNFMDHWWDMFEENNYNKFNYTLNYLEKTYKNEIWWPFGSELALWFYVKHYLSYNLIKEKNYLEINTYFGQFWNPKWKMNVSLVLTLPFYYRIKKIEYSENEVWKELPKQSYWKSWDKLWLNIPFEVNGGVRIYFK